MFAKFVFVVELKIVGQFVFRNDLLQIEQITVITSLQTYSLPKSKVAVKLLARRFRNYLNGMMRQSPCATQKLRIFQTL